MSDAATPTERVEILVVDDQPKVLASIGRILEPMGCVVTSVTSGEEALERTLDHDFAVVLLDVNMPKMNGIETARLLRERKACLGTTLIFFTGGDVDRELILTAYRLGAADFIAKPFDADILRSRVAGAVELHRLRQRENLQSQGLKRLIQDAADGILVLDSSGTIRLANPAAERLLSRRGGELAGQSFGFPVGVGAETEIDLLPGDAGPVTAEMRVVSSIWEGASSWIVSLRDISAKKRLEQWERLGRDVLTLLNRADPSAAVVRGVVHEVKRCLDIEAVGIRLRDGDDYPYYETNGFPDHFVRMESHLCARDAAGHIERDAAGKPYLECMCGNILCGRTDPRQPFFTEGGSFWSNGTTELLASTAEADRQARTRNRCNGEGYESVALIPLRTGDETLGLLQLNDHRKNRFTLDMVHFLEVLCASIGVALARRKTQEELAESEQRFRTLFQFHDTLLHTIPFPIDVVDETGRVLFANGRLEALVGAASPEDRCWTRYKDDKQRCTECPLKQGIAVGETRQLEVAGVLGGRTVEIFHTGMTYQGKPALLEIFNDVTEKKHMQTRLAQSDRLSTMGTLAAGVAHEINNPLAYVLYNIESLSDDLPKLSVTIQRCHAALCSQLGPDAVNELLGEERDFCTPATLQDIAERFRDALSGTVRIKNIVRSLGTFSRVERTEVAPVDLHAAIEHAVTMGFNEIKYRARLLKDFGKVPMVLASDGKVAQVFLNLLINAGHAIGEGHVENNEIRIRTWAEGDAVFAEVSDTGKGIAPEHQGHLFEPFFTTKAVGVGTGLGLSICKNIITGFGGEISFTSELGKGTRFRIRLPRIPNDWEAKRDELKEQTQVHPKVRGRILVVDDEEGIRGAIRRLLAADHEVVMASSGHEGQALLEKDQRFDVIFCDLMMPEMTGMEMHAWLSEKDPALAEQVVFVSGGAFTPGAADYLKKVGNLRVEKPFDNTAFKKLAAELVVAAKAKAKG